ncbi:hypothetical protein BAE44_0024523, partial [Dichanthelium oligosanthes]
LLRWAAVWLSCAARRRYWCDARVQRLAWAGLCRRASTAAAAPPERRGRRSSAAVATGAGVGYDSASYMRNFDDGAAAAAAVEREAAAGEGRDADEMRVMDEMAAERTRRRPGTK